MVKRWLQMFSVLFFVFALTFSANAYFITSSSDPTLSGGMVFTFDSETTGTYNTYTTTNGLVIQSLNDAPFRISADYAGQYNNPGLAIENGTYNTAFTYSIKFSAADGGTTNAFGFNWGAADTVWTLSVYDKDGNLLESDQLPAIGSANNGEFYGIAVNGISYAILTGGSDSADDWVFVDNVTVADGGGAAAVPEPGTMLLLGVGLVGVTVARKKFRK